MRLRAAQHLALLGLGVGVLACQEPQRDVATVPFRLDHNRMLVDAEIRRGDGAWRKARLWVDTGNPQFFLHGKFARELDFDPNAAAEQGGENPRLPLQVRMGGMALDFEGVEPRLMDQPHWLFNATHNDGNLPSTVLRRYQVIFDYPRRELTLAKPGSIEHRGARSPAGVHPGTGIVQLDAVIDGAGASLALDNGASFSFVSGDVLERLARRHPDWPRMTGTAGCANMWGWWPPAEETLTVMRVPEVRWGGVVLANVALVGVPEVSPGGPALGEWYSHKTARPVAGLLGPNAFQEFRVEIDYANGAVYFEKGRERDPHDLDVVGLSLRPEADGSYSVLGVVTKNGNPVVDGLQPGDKLLRVAGLLTTGETMGRVVDALRGKPGDRRALVVERKGSPFTVEAEVNRLP